MPEDDSNDPEKFIIPYEVSPSSAIINIAELNNKNNEAFFETFIDSKNSRIILKPLSEGSCTLKITAINPEDNNTEFASFDVPIKFFYPNVTLIPKYVEADKNWCHVFEENKQKKIGLEDGSYITFSFTPSMSKAFIKDLKVSFIPQNENDSDIVFEDGDSTFTLRHTKNYEETLWKIEYAKWRLIEDGGNGWGEISSLWYEGKYETEDKSLNISKHHKYAGHLVCFKNEEGSETIKSTYPNAMDGLRLEPVGMWLSTPYYLTEEQIKKCNTHDYDKDKFMFYVPHISLRYDNKPEIGSGFKPYWYRESKPRILLDEQYKLEKGAGNVIETKYVGVIKVSFTTIQGKKNITIPVTLYKTN